MSNVALAASKPDAMESPAPVAKASHASLLSLWCDRFIEAGWLAAIVVAPLFFNIYSSRVFEPDKLTTVRSIAIMMAAAWFVKWLEERHSGNTDHQISWRTPLVLPTLLLVAIYMVSTVLSVAPRTSLLGSYQRLQGAYTTFSYIIIFLLMLQGMRRRVQLDRLVNLIIITSLPIALYGMLQRANMDPLPWGGDVTQRVAGNMGNAIFIAAYLIMAFFLNLGKIAEAFGSVLVSSQARISDVIRAAIYILIALINLFVVWALAGSRGPQLGWLVGLFFIVLLLIQILRKRKLRLALTLAYLGVGIAGVVFLLLLNFNRTPLFDRLREFRPFSLMSSVMQTADGTNAVRVLIWKGAVELVLPHQPLSFPDGRADAFNAIRPFVGYGPESMYVAYNPFYPPDLAHFEARNASPDRSHNETWDSLVITGLIGFLAYMLLFGSFFYFGFKWIGLVSSRSERILFPVLWITGGALGAIVGYLLEGPRLFGVGVAAGVAFGLTVYLVVSVLINVLAKNVTTASVTLSLRDQVLLIALVSAVMAHFIEIHTGIAIASTRTHFWVFAAMLVVVGLGYVPESMAALATSDDAAVTMRSELSVGSQKGAPVTSASTRKSRRVHQAGAGNVKRAAPTRKAAAFPPWFSTVTVAGIFLGLILAVLAFDFTNNSDRSTSAGTVFVNALTVVKGQSSYGVLAMFLITWLVGALLLVTDAHRRGTLQIPDTNNVAPLAAAISLLLAVSALVCVAFGTFISGRLVDFVTARENSVDNILGIAEQLSHFPAYLYLLIGVVMVGGALILRGEETVKPKKTLGTGGFAMMLVVIPISLLTVSTSNLQPIAADIIYKQASPWDQQGGAVLQQGTNVQGWDVAIEHYRRSIQLAPNEDFYYLWLGRALLEKAKATQDTQSLKTWSDDASFTKVIDDGSTNWNRQPNTLPSSALSREDLLTAARIILAEARVINPLNTDHSANLARMWRQSGDIATDNDLRVERLDRSSQEYAIATTLSPNNAVLWNEWASLYLYSFADYATAQQKLDKSLALDQKFDQTYLLRGELHMQQAARIDQDRQAAEQVLAQVPITETQQVAEATQKRDELTLSFQSKLREARIEFQRAVEVNPQASQAINVLTYIDQQLGDLTSAISLTIAYIEQNPQDWTGYKNLALLYRDTNERDLARQAVEKAIQLAPQDQLPALQGLLDQLSASN